MTFEVRIALALIAFATPASASVEDFSDGAALVQVLDTSKHSTVLSGPFLDYEKVAAKLNSAGDVGAGSYGLVSFVTVTKTIGEQSKKLGAPIPVGAQIAVKKTKYATQEAQDEALAEWTNTRRVQVLAGEERHVPEIFRGCLKDGAGHAYIMMTAIHGAGAIWSKGDKAPYTPALTAAASGLTAPNKVKLATGIVRGYVQVLRAGITQADRNPNNVVVDSDGKGWVIDFGEAVVIMDKEIPPANQFFQMADALNCDFAMALETAHLLGVVSAEDFARLNQASDKARGDLGDDSELTFTGVAAYQESTKQRMSELEQLCVAAAKT